MRGKAIALVLTLAACSQPPANDQSGAPAPTPSSPTPDSTTSVPASTTITLRTDKSSYRAGDNVTLTIVNGTGRTFTFNPCTRTLEREVNGAWSTLSEERICNMMAFLLDPRATRTEQTDLAPETPAGRYRIVLAFTDDDPNAPVKAERAVSAPISIVR